MSDQVDRHRVFFEASADAMLIIDNGVFVDCNQSTLDMLGMGSREEFFKTHPADLSPETQPDGRDSFEKADEMIAIAMREGSNRFHWVHKRVNGETFPVEVLLTAVPYDDHTTINVVWRDISDRLALEKELMSRRDQLEEQVKSRTEELEQALHGARLLGEAVSQSGASTIITDPRGRIEYVNPAFTYMNGYTPEEIFGKTPSILNAGVQPELFYQDMWATITSGKVWSGTLKNKRKNGEMYWARLKIAPVTNENGHILHYVGIETDITDFIEAKEKAEHANKAKSAFLSAMSHELRTPLNAIMGFSQLLDMDSQTPLTEKQRSFVSNIKSASDHLLGLIDEVLDLARVEAGKLVFNIQSVDLRDMLDECLKLSDGSFNALNVEIIDETRSALPVLKADPLRVKQVILNLISNAKKYNVENGKVYISGELREGGLYRLRVRDTGVGIADDQRDNLFKPFHRLGAENTEVEGTGIGLLLTKQIVEGMNGAIGFESDEGEGTTFWIDIPSYGVQAARPTTFDIRRKDEIALECCSGLHTLLYVEDIAANRDLMTALVDGIPNLQLVCAKTAEEGIRIAKAEKPHLILMDINLPDMSGFDAFEQLRDMEATRQIPVVALSANAMSDAKDKARDLGFLDYMTKPFDVTDLIHVLNTVIEG
ncbi:PAS domain-containing protein [Terasakiella sp. A23]|uniref:hybrid sensor histidine kinase/response regulator n=1 Tax=Terasakiella sp. FCG-A23 TaxID=3080561 RepID=UPI0029529817|nr:PAS domain-containing protein [Terasakiella sp. A23]MDV7340848.1 PAS domain-containing protein [Terasakiella sp. A23]